MGVARVIPAGTLVVAVWFSWTHVAVASAQGNQIDSNRDTPVTPTVERLKGQSGFFDSQGKPNDVTVLGDAQKAFGDKGAVVTPPKRPLRPPGTLGAIPTPKHVDIGPWMMGAIPTPKHVDISPWMMGAIPTPKHTNISPWSPASLEPDIYGKP